MVDASPAPRAAWRKKGQELRALVKKNVILKRRNLCSTVAEYLVPLVILIIMTVLRIKSPTVLTVDEVDREPLEFDRRGVLSPVVAFDGLSTFIRSDQKSEVNNFDFQFAVTPRSNFTEGLVDFILDHERNKRFAGPIVLRTFFDETSFRFFEDEDELIEYVRHRDYTLVPERNGIWSGLVMLNDGSDGNNQYSYRLRLNDTGGDLPLRVPPGMMSSQLDPSDKFRAFVSDEDVLRYQRRSATFWQYMVDEYVTQQATGVPQATTADTLLFASPNFEVDPLEDLLVSTYPLVFAFMFVWLAVQSTKWLVGEREVRTAELIRIMGGSEAMITVSWFVVYVVTSAVLAALVLVVTTGSLYENSNDGLIFALYFEYGIAVWALSYFLGSFFDRAQVAASMVALLFVALFFPYYLVADDNVPESRKTLGCMSPPTCFALFTQASLRLESAGAGVHHNTIDQTVGNFRIITVYWMLAVDIVGLTVLGAYFSAVIPHETGVPRHPLLCLEPAWRRFLAYIQGKPVPLAGGLARDGTDALSREAVADPDATHGGDPLFESVPGDLPGRAGPRSGIVVRKLRREFEQGGRQFVAVNDVSMNMHEGEIFCLLGHNGAGKSTCMSVLTGMITPTAGDALVMGRRISTELSAVRESMGYCPQHDVLFPQLTVREHLELYANVKGMPPRDVAEAVQSMIQELAISEKADVEVQNLSGGQKRKVSVGMAFIGGSRVVFLDEPTTGMDPYSRRSTWEVLRRAKPGRVIILTTHFMDEADELGDRVGIMARGALVCYGSTLFLKDTYGVGYLLTCAVRPGGDPSELQRAVREGVAGAKPMPSASGEVLFRLPVESAKSFPALMRELDDHERFQIDGYSLSVTTLEEVFLRSEHPQTHKDRAKQRRFIKRNETRISGVGRPGAAAAAASKGSRAPSSAMDVPVIEEVGGGDDGGGVSRAGHKTTTAFDGDGDDSDSDETAGVRDAKREAELDAQLAKRFASPDNVFAAFWSHFVAILKKRAAYVTHDKRVFTWQLLYPALVLLLGLIVISVGLNLESPELSMTTASYNAPHRLYFNNDTFGAAATSPFDVLGGDGSLLRGGNNELVPNTVASAADLRVVLNNTGWANHNSKESRYGAIYVNEASRPNARSPYNNSVTLLVNTTAWHAQPVFYNMYSDLNLKHQLGDASASIAMTLHGFPRTFKQSSSWNSIAAVFISIALAFVPASIIGFIVREKQIGMKQQQFIMGMRPLAYWAGNFVWDIVFFMLPILLILLVIVMYGISDFYANGALGPFFTALVTYGTCIIALTYLLSLVFEEHTTAQNVSLIFYIFSGTSLLIISLLMDIIEDTREINSDLKFFYRLFPNYAVGEVMLNLALASFIPGNPDKWSRRVSLNAIIYMVAETVIFLFLLGVSEAILSSPSLRMKLCGRFRDRADPAYERDDDVENERERVESGGADEDLLRVEHLRKVYGSKVAVRDLTFGIGSGVCFGLLGINGAGKTTSMRMLTGDEVPTGGSASVAGHDAMRDLSLARRNLGYCPQFDAVLGKMTARELLSLFCRIRGLPEREVPEYVDAMGERLTLTQYMDQECGSYSGGNRRKLSFGIAMIGAPQVLFVDEMSSGVDPKSRRFLWTLVSGLIEAGRAVVLTTHAMEECEALCNRVGIMVGGRLQCIGTTPHLKAKFGNAFQVDAQARHPPVVAEFFEREYGGTVLEQHSGSIKIRVPRAALSLADLFERLEAEKLHLTIENYAVSDTNLEQIFISFAARQDEERRAVAGIALDSDATAPAVPAAAAKAPAPEDVDIELAAREEAAEAAHLRSQSVEI